MLGKALVAVELQDDSFCHEILLGMRKHNFHLDQSRFHCFDSCLVCSYFHLKVYNFRILVTEETHLHLSGYFPVLGNKT